MRGKGAFSSTVLVLEPDGTGAFIPGWQANGKLRRPQKPPFLSSKCRAGVGETSDTMNSLVGATECTQDTYFFPAFLVTGHSILSV